MYDYEVREYAIRLSIIDMLFHIRLHNKLKKMGFFND